MPQVVVEDPDDVGGQRAVRLAAKVGHVDGDAAARLEDPPALAEHVAQQLEVLGVGRRDDALAQGLLVLLAGEVGRRRDDEGHRVVGEVHRPGVPAHEGVFQDERLRQGLVGGEVLRVEPGVEPRGVVALAPSHPEVARRRAPFVAATHRRETYGDPAWGWWMADSRTTAVTGFCVIVPACPPHRSVTTEVSEP